MNKFDSLPLEKQKPIIEAIFKCFGELGYKKASTADIAKMAGISKAMIFHYFGTKKEMYLYAIDFCMKEAMSFINAIKEEMPHDFFARIIFVSKYKIEMLKKFPNMMQFLTCMIKEDDPEISENIQAIRKRSHFVMNEFVLTDIDKKKFKDSVNPELVLELMVSYSYGTVNMVKTGNNDELDLLLDKMVDCLTMLRNHFYKEEYLK